MLWFSVCVSVWIFLPSVALPCTIRTHSVCKELYCCISLVCVAVMWLFCLYGKNVSAETDSILVNCYRSFSGTRRLCDCVCAIHIGSSLAHTQTHTKFIEPVLVYIFIFVCVYSYWHMVEGMMCTNVCITFFAVAFAHHCCCYCYEVVPLLLFMGCWCYCCCWTFYSHFIRAHSKISLLCEQFCEKATHIIHIHPFWVGIHMMLIRFDHVHVISMYLYTRVKKKEISLSFRTHSMNIIYMYVAMCECVSMYMCSDKTKICMCVQYFAHYSDNDEIMGRKVPKEDTLF